jgi:DNA polymerase (family 10)
MPSNRNISHMFDLYAQLLDLHGQETRLSDLLSGAAYRIGRMEQQVDDLKEKELAELFPPEIVKVITQIRRGEISALEELIQLTPPGLVRYDANNRAWR